MKVLHLIDTFWLGGAQTLLKDYFENQKDNTDIFLYSLRKRDVNIFIDHKNVFCDPSPSRFSRGRIPRLIRFIRKNQILLLHCHLPHSQFTGYILKRLYFKNIRLIFHDHSDIMEPAIHVRMALRFTQHRADKVVTCAQHLVKHLEAKAGIAREKIVVIPNFILPEKFSAATTGEVTGFRKSLGIPPGTPVAGFAGRFVERKGWRDFIEAAAIVSQQNPACWFVMAGTGPDLEKAKTLAKKRGLSRLIFAGYLSEMSVFYRSLNVFVVPSHWEGMPLAPAEALAAGTPVVAYDAPGLRYGNAVDESIDYAKIFDHNQLAGLIIPLLNGEKKMKEPQELSYLSLGRFKEDVKKLYAVMVFY
jgi:glycosyltransferase involved in cell wall biosynthesis